MVSKKKESLPRRRWCLPKQRGPPRRGNVRLGDLKDRKLGLSSPPR